MRKRTGRPLHAGARSRQRGRTLWCLVSSPLVSRPGTAISRQVLARTALYGEAGCGSRRAIPGCRQLLLEQWNVLVEREDCRGRAAGAFAENGGCPGGDRGRVRLAEICEYAPQAVSALREHQRRLRAARAAICEGRGRIEYLLPAREFWVERPGVVDGASRAPECAKRKPGWQCTHERAVLHHRLRR